MPAREAIYYNEQRQIVQGVFYVAGRRLFRRLCTFAEAHVDPTGAALPSMTPAARKDMLDRLYADAERKLAREKPKPPRPKAPSGPMVSALWDDFLKASRTDRAPGTVKLYALAKARYLAANGDHRARELTPHHVDRLRIHLNGVKVNGRKLSPQTVRQQLTCLQAFLRWAWEHDELDKLPKVKVPRVDAKKPRVLAPEELRDVFANLGRLYRSGRPDRRRRYRLMLRFAFMGFGCGLRRGEIASLRWAQIDLKQGLVTVQITRQFRTKERREKTIPMPAFLQKFLELERATHAKGEVWYLDNGLKGKLNGPAYKDPHSITTAFRRQLRAIGHEGAKPTHGLRALFATLLHNRGADAYTIQQMMGHSSIGVTEGYFAHSEDAKRRAASLLNMPRTTRKAVNAGVNGS